MSKKTIDLLDKLRRINEEEDDEYFDQCVSPPDLALIEKGIPTLEQGIFVPASGMIRARFEYAGRWEDAFLDHWLSLKEMARVPSRKKTMQRIHQRIEDWEGAVIGDVKLSELSLFGFDGTEQTETYLVWSDKKEPSVVYYHDQHENKFPNLNAYLKYITT